MPATASIRDLRNRFPRIRKLLEEDGEVVLTEGGAAKYRLTAYNAGSPKAPPSVDYWQRLTAYQPSPMTAAQAQSLTDENRGER